MAKFIKVLTREGEMVRVNVDHIIQYHKGSGDHNDTLLHLSNNKVMLIKSTVDYVDLQINGEVPLT